MYGKINSFTRHKRAFWLNLFYIKNIISKQLYKRKNQVCFCCFFCLRNVIFISVHEQRRKLFDLSVKDVLLRDRNHVSLAIFGMLNETEVSGNKTKIYKQAVSEIKTVRAEAPNLLFLFSSLLFFFCFHLYSSLLLLSFPLMEDIFDIAKKLEFVKVK